jgi:hypothetical protein
MQYKTVQVIGQQKQSGGFLPAFESWEAATTRTIMENVKDGWRFVSAFGSPGVYLIFEKP